MTTTINIEFDNGSFAFMLLLNIVYTIATIDDSLSSTNTI